MSLRQSEPGKRLREVRGIFNNGFKATILQFATELGETNNNISNYENGKANIPTRVLITLFEMGFNPVYILTGSGSMYADNLPGKTKKELDSGKSKGNAKLVGSIDNASLSMEELNRKASEHIAAAGDIMKLIEKKRRSSMLK